jgi:hypothetical protein
MSFDARSLERLEALGRTLPQKLPLPTPPAPPADSNGQVERAVDRRHPVETEQDPERLFRELMDVSPDGSIPPHLMERLRQLEGQRPGKDLPAASQPGPATAASPGAPGRKRPTKSMRNPMAGDPQQDLYTAFQQLLLEEDD